MLLGSYACPHSMQARTPPDARILKLREAEDRLARIQNAVKVRYIIMIQDM